MICCGSVSDFEKVLVPVPGSGFGFGRRQYLAHFFTINCTKSYLFYVRSSLVLPRKLASDFLFFLAFLLHCMLDPDPKSGFGSRPGSGSVKTKSYGSFSSGSGSTTQGTATLPAASSDKVESRDGRCSSVE
jgi:hypothetical protein